MIRNRFALVLLALLWVVIPVHGQADLDRLDTYFESARVEWDIPGMAVAIVKDGKIVHMNGYGVLEVGSDEPVDEHTLFAIASNSKAFLASSVASLVDEGKMSWDDRIVDHLPYFRLVDEVAGQRATIRDALSHAVGLGTYSGDVIWFKTDKTSEEIVRHIAHLEPAFEFRNGYAYSNVMYVATGEVLGAVAGKTWDAYIRDHFFEPLGMNRSQTGAEAALALDNVATPHKLYYGENTAVPWASWTAGGSGAAAGIVSTAHDMAQWLKLHLNEGIISTDTLFTARSQQVMWHPHHNYTVTPATRETYPGRNFNAYGLGFGVSDYRGHFMAAHGGAYDGMYSRVAMVPGEELGIVVLTNTMKGIGTWMVYDIVDAFLGSSVRDWSAYGLEWDNRSKAAFDARLDAHKASRVEGTEASLSTDQMTGRYHDPLYGNIDIVERNGELRMEFPRAPRLGATLTHWHYDTWQINWDETHAWFDFGTVQFDLNNEREVTGLTFSVPNEDIFFEEISPVKVR